MKLTTHLHLVLRLGLCGAIPPLPDTSSWCGALLSIVYIFMVWYIVKHRNNFNFSIL